MNVDQVMQLLSPDLIERFKTAVELGKWPDGRSLDSEQREICLQAIILFENKHLAPEMRTGYVPPKESACEHDNAEEDTQPLQWKQDI